MNVFDLIVLVTLIFLTLRGVWKGMVSQIVSVGSYIVCWIVASRFAFMIAPSIPAEEPWDKVGAMIVLFVITMIAIRYIHKLLEKWIKDLKLAKLNGALGGVLGFAKGILICMVLTFFGVMLSEATRSVIFHSKSGRHLSDLIAKTGAFIPSDTGELLRVQIAKFNAKIEGGEFVGDDGTPVPKFSFSTGDQNSENHSGTGITDLISRSGALLEEAQHLREEYKNQSQDAASLLDAIGSRIRRWWNGEEKTSPPDTTQNVNVLPHSPNEKSNRAQPLAAPTPPENHPIPKIETASVSTSRDPKPGFDAPPVGNTSMNHTANYAANQAAKPTFADSDLFLEGQTASAPPSRYREETLFQRRALAENAVAAELLPQSASLPKENAPFSATAPSTYGSANAAANAPASDPAFPMPRSARRFLPPRNSAGQPMRSSDILSNATRSTNSGEAAPTPATLYSPAGQRKRSANPGNF